MRPENLKMVILAGGLGTRLSEETVIRPKPMVEIGERPILWHIMQLCAAQGLREFVVALGYKGQEIKRYFLDYRTLHASLSISLANGDVTVRDAKPPDWRVHLVDTGQATQTGGRLKRIAPYVAGGTFLVTYGDGLADIDLAALLAFHRAHGRLATITAVRPPSRFGSLRVSGDTVAAFEEKPQTEGGWINGGFFVLEPACLDYIEGDDTLWERAPLERLAQDSQLMAYKHEGFFQPMDTLREKQLLEDLWQRGEAPWKRW